MRKTYKFLSFIICIGILFTSFFTIAYAEGSVTEEQPEEPEMILGDMNESGRVDTEDARLILRLSANMEAVTDEHILKGDMNADGVITLEDAVAALRESVTIGGVVLPNRNGDAKLFDDPNNEFIKLIAETYDLDPASLVAICSVPDSGTNYVLRFKKNYKTGEYDKSVDGLEYVYHIGKAPEREISYTNGKTKNYNCNYAEGKIVFNIVQTMVMPQYPTYFEGVEEVTE